MSAIADQDGFLFDSDQIRARAEPNAARAGVRPFKHNRVTGLERENERLWAEVEDEETEDKLSFALAYNADGNLQASCACAARGDQPCLHALAAPFAYATRFDSPGEVAGAVESAIDERAELGRAEVKVE